MYDTLSVHMGYYIEEENSEDREWGDMEWIHFGDIPFTSLFDVRLPTREEFGWDELCFLIEDSEGLLESIPMEIK